VRALITGVGGFAGSHLADHLVECGGGEVHGVARPGGDLSNVAHLGASLALHLGDVADPLPLVVDDHKAVGVAVEGEAGVRLFGGDGAAKTCKTLRPRL
jgi:nucleoside-diphosphate-sugar epimerase